MGASNRAVVWGTSPQGGCAWCSSKAPRGKRCFPKAPLLSRAVLGEGRVWTRPQGRRGEKTIIHWVWQRGLPEISFKRHSSVDLRTATSRPAGQVSLTARTLARQASASPPGSPGALLHLTSPSHHERQQQVNTSTFNRIQHQGHA